ncbi:MAG: hypothetical protein H6580_00275 [Flammeovirgaceae bacterium]|nr:hypothetical protein [Flammeovirgaceae bacterium]
MYLTYENESNNYVYFDDLKVTYTKSQVVQSNNYYAFGLQTKDSWTRMATQPNQYLYNAGSELNEATSNYEMMYRSYDPAIGRMSGVDPMVDKYASMTPYNYSMNDPIYYNDPSGAEYEWASMGGCGCWRDKGPQDGGGQSNGMYGSNWNAATYGTGFAKYGPGDGGALDNLGDAAAARLKLKQWINDGLIVSVTDQSQIATLVNAHKAGAGITLGSNGFWTHAEGFYRSSITGVELGTFTQNTYYRVQRQEIGSTLSGTIEQIWNSPFVRWVIPDVLTIDASASSTFFWPGRSVSASLNIITRGSDKGFKGTYTYTKGRIGFEVDAGFNAGFLYFNSLNPANFKSDFLLGKTETVSAGFLYGGNVVRGFNDEGKVVIFGASTGIGATLGGSYGKGRTSNTFVDALYGSN